MSTTTAIRPAALLAAAPAHRRTLRRPNRVSALVASGALALGLVGGTAIGRATAPVPEWAVQRTGTTTTGAVVPGAGALTT